MSDWLKTLLFCLNPEAAHGLVKTLSSVLPHSLWQKQNRVSSPILQTRWQNLVLENPIGLAAGFDKSGELLQLIQSLGFGFAELGSVTLKACVGNPKPRVFRLKNDEAIINWMGLPNPGVEKFLDHLKQARSTLPRGISVVKTPDHVYETQKLPRKNGIEDFVDTYTLTHDRADYICLNLSCPNSGETTLFESPKLFDALAREIALARTSLESTTPILIKISPALNADDLRKTVDIALKYDFDGFVVSNTTTERPNLKTPMSLELKNRGGLSGKPMLAIANRQLARVFEIVGKSKLVVGVGGIHDLNSLLSKLQNGAQWVQAYTGLIYGGPRFVRDLNLALVEFCQKRGVKHYRALVGEKIF